MNTQIIHQAAGTVAGSPIVGHFLNPEARRRTMSLGDATGLHGIGIHLTILAPGDASTEQHTHTRGEEFIYIVSGRGTVLLGSERHAVQAGDFIGFPARGPAHGMLNMSGEELVYLVGGDRPAFDVIDYPRLGKRLYVYQGKDGRQHDLVDREDLKS